MDKERQTELVLKGVALMTAHLDRDAATGQLDRRLLEATLGPNPGLDDFIEALGGVMIVSEIALMMHWMETEKPPSQILQEIAEHNSQG